MEEYFYNPPRHKLEELVNNYFYGMKNYVAFSITRLCKEEGDAQKNIVKEVSDRLNTGFNRCVDLLENNIAVCNEWLKAEAKSETEDRLSAYLEAMGCGCDRAVARKDQYISAFPFGRENSAKEKKWLLKEILLDEIYLMLTQFRLMVDKVCQYVFPVQDDVYSSFSQSLEPLRELGKKIVKNIEAILKEALAVSEEAVQAEAEMEETVQAEQPKIKLELILPTYSTQLQASALETLDNLEVNSDFYIEAGAMNGRDNKSYFEGVLLPVESVSDSAPAKGSSVPLYVSREVALLAAQQINSSGGLPLDVASDFNGHNDQGVVGIMTSADVIGGNLVVRGHLFPFNNPNLVEQIKAMKNHLGMSINAIAQGVREYIDGKEVFNIKSLQPLGANILKSARATWKNTAVLQAEEKDTNDFFLEDDYTNDDNDDNIDIKSATIRAEEIGIASDFIEERTTMDDIYQIYQGLCNKMDTYLQCSEAEYETLKNSNSLLETQINILREEVKALKQKDNVAIQAQRLDEERQLQAQAQQELIETITNNVSDRLIKAINPSGQPPRKTAPLIQASSGGQRETTSPVQELLIAAEARLKTLEDLGEIGPQRIQAQEEVTSLRRRLMSGY